MKRIWNYGTSTPIQRVGVIFLAIGLFSLFSWIFKEDLSFSDLLDPYYLPKSRDSFLFHLFIYFIPLGLLMSWGYQILIKVKDWVLSGNTKTPNSPKNQKLYFKDAVAAYEFACTIYPPKLDLNMSYVGLVKDIVLTTSERFQYTIELANSDTPIKVYGYNDEHSKTLRLNNLVLWQCEKPVSKNQLNIEALGTIVAILQPVFDPSQNVWLIHSNLTK